jgi:hypothetical protein
MTDSRYRVVCVSDLPWPHRPFKCGLKEDFSRFAPGWEGWDQEEAQDAFRRFIESRPPADFERCGYHDVDWPRLAEDAIRLLDEADGERPGRWDIEDAFEAEGRADDAGYVWSFFDYDAIVWPDGGETVENGQHRVCALKQMGAVRCVAVRPGE